MRELRMAALEWFEGCTALTPYIAVACEYIRHFSFANLKRRGNDGCKPGYKQCSSDVL
jgi:hypothetical protein